MTQIHQRSVGDRYELLGELGRDAGRSVWRGRDRVTGAEVAVKVLRPELVPGPEALDELRHTLDLIRRLGHPGILAVSEVAMFGDRVALVSELLTGESLRKLLTAHGPLPPDPAVRTMAAVCRALAAAHSVGVVHGALTPSQLRLEPKRSIPGGVLLADFGTAALFNQAAAAGQLQPASPAYQAPEVLQGRPGTTAADVYAVGALLYEALSGQRPFSPQHHGAAAATTATTTTAAATSAEPGPPAAPSPGPELPDTLWHAILGCVTPDPERRPSAEELAELLDSFAPPGTQPTSQPTPQTVPQPAPQWAPPPISRSAPQPVPQPAPQSAPPPPLPRATVPPQDRTATLPPPLDDYTSLFLPVIRPDAPAVLRADFGRPVAADPSDERTRAGKTRHRVAQVAAGVAVLAAVALVLGLTLGKPSHQTSAAGDSVQVLTGAGTDWPSATGSPLVVPSSPLSTTLSSHTAAPVTPGTLVVAGGSSSPTPGTAQTSPAAGATSPAASPTTPKASASPSNSIPAPGSTGTLTNASSGTCLATYGPYANGSIEVIWSCGVPGVESWTLTSSGTLTQDGGRYCLDDYSYGNKPGTEVDLWSCNGGSNQKWTLRSDGSIAGVYSGLCLDIAGSGRANGTAIQLSTCNGHSSEQWTWKS